MKQVSLIMTNNDLEFYSLQRKRHFWKLDTRAATLYQDEVTTRYYKVIPDPIYNETAYALTTPQVIFLPVVFLSFFFGRSMQTLRSQWNVPMIFSLPHDLDL